MVAAAPPGCLGRCIARSGGAWRASVRRRLCRPLLPIYLVERGFSALAVGTIVTGTLVGTALMTLWVGWIANRYSRRLLLLTAAVLMVATGAGFVAVTSFWPLLVIAVVGTMNPTSGDASIFVPLEQTVLTETIEPRRRTALFARYSVIGSCATALGV